MTYTVCPEVCFCLSHNPGTFPFRVEKTTLTTLSSSSTAFPSRSSPGVLSIRIFWLSLLNRRWIHNYLNNSFDLYIYRRPDTRCELPYRCTERTPKRDLGSEDSRLLFLKIRDGSVYIHMKITEKLRFIFTINMTHNKP